MNRYRFESQVCESRQAVDRFLNSFTNVIDWSIVMLKPRIGYEELLVTVKREVAKWEVEQ